jgi:hypothetical protein
MWTKYCGTATKVGGNRENKPGPVVMGVSCLLENAGMLEYWVKVLWIDNLMEEPV